MATKVLMPKLGESVVDGTVNEWLKREGEHVEQYESIVRVSTDKVDTEIPSPAGGTLLKIYVHEGETVDAGVVLALLGEPGETATEAPARADHHGNGQKAESAPVMVAVMQQPPSGSAYAGHVTPVVARMAAEHQLDLSQIKGTGRDGRITKKDVEAYLQDSKPAPQPVLAPWEQPGSGDLFKPAVSYELEEEAPTKSAPKAPAAPTPTVISTPAPIPAGVPGELVQLSSMRRSIANHMVKSKLHTSPHVTTVFEVDLSAVLKHRESAKPALEKQGVNLTLTPYFVAASVVALREVPYVNSQWTDEGIYLHHAAHIGIAVAIDDGLIVPVIKNAQDYNLTGLARMVNDLSQRARNRQLKPDEVQGGTFTITNHGVSGSLFATPIINQPQSAILGVGMMEKRVKVIDDAIAIRPCAYLSLTFDHRIIDGAAGDGFMQMVKRELENWS